MAMLAAPRLLGQIQILTMRSCVPQLVQAEREIRLVAARQEVQVGQQKLQLAILGLREPMVKMVTLAMEFNRAPAETVPMRVVLVVPQ
jgi:hypothetical protein